MNPSQRFSICLYSEPNFVALNLLENLLSKNCVINIYSDDERGWRKITGHLSTINKFSISPAENFLKSTGYNYAIFTAGFSDGINFINGLNDFVSGINKAKSLIILPSELSEFLDFDRVKISGNSSLILVGDVFGPRMDLDSGLFAARCVSDSIRKRKLFIPIGESFYPIFIADLVKLIIKWLFSFGPFGHKILLLGNQTSDSVFWVSLKRIIPDLELKHDSKSSPRYLPQNMEAQTIESNLNFILNETYGWLGSHYIDAAPKKGKKAHPPKKRIFVSEKTPLSKPSKKIFWALFTIFVLPFFSLFISLLLIFLSYKFTINGNTGISTNTILISGVFAVFAQKESAVLSYIPGIGLIYKETKFAGEFINNTDRALIHLLPIVKNSADLFNKILGTEVYDINGVATELGIETALLYSDSVLIKNLTYEAAGKKIILAEALLKKVNIDKYVNLISQTNTISKKLENIFGNDKSKTYLVLFENNMELRPTGGFIGSFGLMTFDKGRLSDLTINDVYSADGQLNGHVEPPAAIRKYLNEANWWLRDSNWDPDFPTSAKRAEWFLDKELGREVDGVVAIDLSPIKEILKVTGPVFLSDYGMEITSGNLYEKTQSEVQDNSFAGTHQKASFLTALSRNLLSTLSNSNGNQKLMILKLFYGNLEGRHVQMYLHNEDVQNAIANLSWDGSVLTPDCGDSCYADFVGVVEANVGVNKANYFIDRNTNLNVLINPSGITRTLSLTLKNKANRALGVSGRYVNYVRLLMPLDTEPSVSIISGNFRQSLTPEVSQIKNRKEVGLPVEILAGDTKTIEFSWVTKINVDSVYSGYGLYLRKQAGIGEDPISINIKRTDRPLKADSRFSLTKGGGYGYNTTLAEDVFSRFSW